VPSPRWLDPRSGTSCGELVRAVAFPRFEKCRFAVWVGGARAPRLIGLAPSTRSGPAAYALRLRSTRISGITGIRFGAKTQALQRVPQALSLSKGRKDREFTPRLNHRFSQDLLEKCFTFVWGKNQGVKGWSVHASSLIRGMRISASFGMSSPDGWIPDNA
jgi:hypothetical protein